MLLCTLHRYRNASSGGIGGDLLIIPRKAFAFDELETADPRYGRDPAHDPERKDEVANLAAVTEECTAKLKPMCSQENK